MKFYEDFAEQKIPHRQILAIDLKSFFASVECVDRGLDPFTTPLIVADKSRGPGTIVLAVSPYCKSLGIPSRLRFYDVPKIPNLIVAKPRMQRYLTVSAEVVSIFLDFVKEEDIHVYSIDESFLDITDYSEAKKIGAVKFAKKIINKIKETLGLTVTVGIGENIFMAKAAMDIEAKKSPDFIAKWTYDDIPNHLWPLSPLSKMWGIGSRMEKRLNDLGFHKVGDIASSTMEFMKAKFGVIGEEIYNHAHGIDFASLHEQYIPEETSLGVGQVLFEDYSYADAIYPIMEMTEELVLRLLHSEQITGRVGLFVGYSSSDGGGGFGGHFDLLSPTDDELEIKAAIKNIFYAKANPERKIRRLNITAMRLTSNKNYQLNLLEDYSEIEKKRSLSNVILNIKEKYGTDKITKAISAYEKSNFKKRHSEIGGHHK